MRRISVFPSVHIQRAPGRPDALFGEWLTMRANRYIDRPGATLDRELASEQRREQIAIELAPIPARDPFSIIHKIEILEAELSEKKRDDAHVLYALVAGIKADVAKLAEASC